MEMHRNQNRAETAGAGPIETAQGYDGVVIGILLGFHDDGAPLVAFPGNPQETARKARAATTLQGTDVGREVVLLFEGGDPRLPLVIGVIQHPGQKTQAPDTLHRRSRRRAHPALRTERDRPRVRQIQHYPHPRGQDPDSRRLPIQPILGRQPN